MSEPGGTGESHLAHVAFNPATFRFFMIFSERTGVCCHSVTLGLSHQSHSVNARLELYFASLFQAFVETGQVLVISCT